jgi:hypothetical protein
VIERSATGVTYVNNDRESARQIRVGSRLWQEQDIRVAYLAGYGYSITRVALIGMTSRVGG